MKTNPLQQDRAITLDEITFENRNHAYGAYNLRKKYPLHLFWAFFIAFSLMSISIAAAYFSANKKVDNTLKVDVTLLPTQPPPKTITPPPPPPPIRSLLRAIHFTPPVVVDSMKPEIAFNTRDFDDPEPVPENTGEIAPFAKGPIDEVETPRIVVQYPAQFQGGSIENFRAWVASQIKYPQKAAESDIQGIVYIQFVVNKNGAIENVKIMRKIDPSLEEEAIRVIKSSPIWTPAMENNKKYAQLFTLPVNFQLQK